MPLLAPLTETSTLSVLKNNNDANNSWWGKRQKNPVGRTKPGFALTPKMATHQLFSPLAWA